MISYDYKSIRILTLVLQFSKHYIGVDINSKDRSDGQLFIKKFDQMN